VYNLIKRDHGGKRGGGERNINLGLEEMQHHVPIGVGRNGRPLFSVGGGGVAPSASSGIAGVGSPLL
jgi:hypothetical protein